MRKLISTTYKYQKGRRERIIKGDGKRERERSRFQQEFTIFMLIRFHCILLFVLQVLEEEYGLSKDNFTKLKAEHEYVLIKYIVLLIHYDILINSCV